MHTQPVEDIDAVIGRFQAWAGARNAPETKPGIREMSYDEALESRRYRWKGGKTAPVKNTRTTERPTEGSKEEPGARQVPAPNAVAARSATRERERSRHSPAAARTHEERSSAARKVDGRDHAAKASREAPASTVAQAVPAAKKPPASKAHTQAAPPPVPQFKEALARAVYPAEVVVSARPTELARQVAVSVRLTPSERALLRTRAAEAGVPMSAYFRQCALEVEQLRAQVKQALAAMEQGTTLPNVAPEPLTATKPGSLTRLMRRLFPASAPSVVLRA